MLIVADEIVDRKFFKESNVNNIQNASYYLTIGAIIPAGEDIAGFDPKDAPTDIVMKPGQIAWVVSNEIFDIDDHSVTALVTLRSTFTKLGLLALDVGLVDGDYQGPIGSVVINFSKNDVTLQKDQKFFRVMFFGHDKIPSKYITKRAEYSHVEYIRKQYGNMVSGFPGTFLNTQEIEKSISKKLSSEIYEKISSDIETKILANILKNHKWKIFWLLLLIFASIALAAGFVYSNIPVDPTIEWLEKTLENNKNIKDLVKKMVK